MARRNDCPWFCAENHTGQTPVIHQSVTELLPMAEGACEVTMRLRQHGDDPSSYFVVVASTIDGQPRGEMEMLPEEACQYSTHLAGLARDLLTSRYSLSPGRPATRPD